MESFRKCCDTTKKFTVNDIPSEKNPNAGIVDWENKVMKKMVSDENLAKILPSKQVNSGLVWAETIDTKEFYVFSAKLSYLGDEKSSSVNVEKNDGSILVGHSRSDKEFVTKNNKLKFNKDNNSWIAVVVKPKDSKGDSYENFVFRGYYTYSGIENFKYKLIPVKLIPFTESDDSFEQISETDESCLEEPAINPDCTIGNNFKRKKSCENSKNVRIPSKNPFYKGKVWDSVLECKYAFFMDLANVPYNSQVPTGILEESRCYKEYNIDFHCYPNDRSKEFYIEVKPFKPSMYQEQLCERVSHSKGVPVHIFYGNFEVPFSIEKDYYPNGYSVVSFININGNVVRDEGFCFMDKHECITVEKKSYVSDMSHYTMKLKYAYESTVNNKFVTIN